MSVENMLSALNLEMSAKAPRTEYSAHTHWPLLERVPGLRVDADSTPEEREEASRQFVRAWDYSMMWNVCISSEIFGDQRTSMGHAVYAEGGTDYNDQIFQLFEDPRMCTTTTCSRRTERPTWMRSRAAATRTSICRTGCIPTA